MKQKVFCLFLFLFTINHAVAEVKASVDRHHITLGESLTLTLSTPESNTPNLTPLKKNFDIYGTTQSSQTQIVNGKLSSSHQVIVTLLPKHAGKLTIPALTIGQAKTNPININVIKPALGQLGTNDSPLFLRASVSQLTSYIHTPLIYTLKLYYANNITSGNLSVPNGDNFTLTPYGKKLSYSDNIKGRIYRVIEQRYLLNASDDGLLQLKPALFSGTVADNNQTNDFFGITTGKPIQAQSNSVKLNIKAIPKGISPLNWLPATMVTLHDKWSADLNHFAIGKPITRTITLTAKGVLSKNLPDVTFTTPPSFNAYPDKPQTTNEIINNTLVARKQYKIAYLPTQAGEITFPAIKIQWWNIKTHKPEVTTLPAITGKVIKSATEANAAKNITLPTSKNSTNANPKSIRMVTKWKTPADERVWHYTTLTLLFLWLLTLSLWWYQTRKQQQAKKKVAVNSTTNGVQTESLQQILNRLKKICQTNRAKSIQTALIDWAKVYYQDTAIYSLYAIKKRESLNSLTAECDILEEALYTNKPYTRGDKLWSAIEIIIKQNQQKKVKGLKLKPFYPDEK